MMYKPSFMAYELRLLCHMNPDFYAIRTVFIGGGGGLQYIDLSEALTTSMYVALRLALGETGNESLHHSWRTGLVSRDPRVA